MCCCIKQNRNKSAFASIAETLSCFFHKYDVVPTDILAGMLLIRDKQKERNDSMINVNLRLTNKKNLLFFL